MATNQSAPSLNRALSSNFWWLRSTNHVTFTEEYVMCMEIHTNVYKQNKHVFELKRWSMKWKHTNSPVKKKSQAQWSEKKIILTVFWDMKGPITIDFFEKGTTVFPTVNSEGNISPYLLTKTHISRKFGYFSNVTKQTLLKALLYIYH